MTTDKEQRLESAIIKILRDEGISFRPSNTYSDVKDVAFEAIKSDAAREYWQSQKQETPELEEIRKEYKNIIAHLPVLDKEAADVIWNHFAPYIKGTDAVESDAIAFHKWLLEEIDIENLIHTGEYFCFETQKYHDIGGLYDMFKSLPKAPKEVPND